MVRAPNLKSVGCGFAGSVADVVLGSPEFNFSATLVYIGPEKAPRGSGQ